MFHATTRRTDTQLSFADAAWCGRDRKYFPESSSFAQVAEQGRWLLV